MTSEDTFTPVAVHGPFEKGRTMFAYQAGYVSPRVAWADVCEPGLPPADGFLGAHYRAHDMDLPVEPEAVARACEALFGPPRPTEGRGYPTNADWIVSTPMDGIVLTVCLEADDINRFGFGMTGRMPTTGKAAFQAREVLIQEALRTAMVSVRQEMGPSPERVP